MDLDGTVSNPQEGVTKAVAYALKSFGIVEDDLNKLCKFIGPPLTDSFQQHQPIFFLEAYEFWK